jgi:hypothetical protein
MESDKRSVQVERLEVVKTGARNFSFKRSDEFEHGVTGVNPPSSRCLWHLACLNMPGEGARSPGPPERPPLSIP